MPNLNKFHTGLFLVILAIAPQVRSQVPDYEPPRTEYGRPDLQGIWTVSYTHLTLPTTPYV